MSKYSLNFFVTVSNTPIRSKKPETKVPTTATMVTIKKNLFAKAAAASAPAMRNFEVTATAAPAFFAKPLVCCKRVFAAVWAIVYALILFVKAPIAPLYLFVAPAASRSLSLFLFKVFISLSVIASSF